ncbi:MAG: TIGR02597 family protein [Verrucomicrobiota bacterium]
MQPKLRYSLAAALLTVALTPLSAQSVTTTPVGAVSMEALANSDTLLTTTLVRPSVYQGTVTNIEGNNLTLSGFSFADGDLQYQVGVQSNTYYLHVISGEKAGHYSTVIANNGSAVTLEFEDDIISGLAQGDSVVIRPYWTLGTLFPAVDAGKSFIASTNNFGAGRRTEILFPNVVGAGINKSTSVIYYFNSYWRMAGNVAPNRDDVIVPPDTYFTIRNNNGSDSTDLTTVGEVDAHPFVVSIAKYASSQTDNPVSMIRPVEMKLGELGLDDVFVPSTNNFSSGRGDELLVYDSSTAVKNRSATSIYFFNGFWRRAGNVGVNQNETLIPAGAALVIRKQKATVNDVEDWVIPPLSL